MATQKTSKAFSLIELSIVILIIGIIIAGVTQGSRLVVKMRLNTARNFTQSSDVGSIKDLILWLDATREGVLTNAAGLTNLDNNDLIQAWQSYNPQYATAINFTQVTAGLMPAYVESGINNLPTLYFDAATTGASGKTLSQAFLADLNPSQFTVFVVTKPVEATTSFGTILMNRNSGNFSGYNLYKGNNVSTFEFWLGDSTNWNGSVSYTFASFNTPYLLSLVRDSNTGFNYIYENGVSKASNSPTSNNFTPNTGATFTIGTNDTSTIYYDGQISEIIIYARTLKTEERKAVEKYLGKKYAIKISS